MNGNEQLETLRSIREKACREAREAHVAERIALSELDDEIRNVREALAQLRRRAQRMRLEMSDLTGPGALSSLRRRRMFLQGCDIEEEELEVKIDRLRSRRAAQKEVVADTKERLTCAQRQLEALEAHLSRLDERAARRRKRRVSRQRDEVASRVWRERRDE